MYSPLPVKSQDVGNTVGIEVTHGGGIDAQQSFTDTTQDSAQAENMGEGVREVTDVMPTEKSVQKVQHAAPTDSRTANLGGWPSIADTDFGQREYVSKTGQPSLGHTALPNTPLQLNNGTTVYVPEHLSRFHVPWFVPHKSFRLKSLREANYRVLYSPVRHAMSDGIGHSMAIMNYEIRVAQKLDIAYSHRISNYSSLTENDTSAVEDFFGWGGNVGLNRSDLQKEACIPEGGQASAWSSDVFSRRYHCNICANIQNPNKYGLKRIVNLDESVTYQCVNRTRTHQVCDADIANFLEKHDRSHTLFQLPTEVCDKPVSDSTFGFTKVYFWHKYWDRHSHHVQLESGLSNAPSTRTLSLSEDALTIAVHVRRGDFIHEPAVRKKRIVIPDEAYAHLISRALQVVHNEGGVFSKMGIHVLIFSEGRVVESGPLSSHSVSAQDKVYYDSTGKERSFEWWEKLIAESAGQQFAKDVARSATGPLWRSKEALRNVMGRLEVQLRIAEPTLQSMHEMASSDIFIGSKSGLSTHAVWALSRGVSLIPSGAPIASEGMPTGPAKERICCTVGFDVQSLRFNTEKFRTYWHAYAVANGPSAARAVRSGR